MDLSTVPLLACYPPGIGCRPFLVKKLRRHALWQVYGLRQLPDSTSLFALAMFSHATISIMPHMLFQQLVACITVLILMVDLDHCKWSGADGVQTRQFLGEWRRLRMYQLGLLRKQNAMRRNRTKHRKILIDEYQNRLRERNRYAFGIGKRSRGALRKFWYHFSFELISSSFWSGFEITAAL